MFWTILIIGVVFYILYSFFRDRDHMLRRQVDMQGGMAKKYEYLIDRMTNDPSARVVKVTRDHIHIRATEQTTETNYFITEGFNIVEIEWVGQMAMLGIHKQKWSFPHNYPQEKIIEEIGGYLVMKTNQMSSNNF